LLLVVADEVRSGGDSGGAALRDAHRHTFLLPNMMLFSEEFRDFVRRDLYQLDHATALQVTHALHVMS
jgi:hypothetical protein